MHITTRTDLHPPIQNVGGQFIVPLAEQPKEEETTAPIIDDFVPYTPPAKHFGAFISQSFKAYGASLIVTFIALPIVTSAVTVGIYLTHSPSSFAIVLGAITTSILWWIAALPFSYFTRASGANTVSYGLLLSRLRLLEAHLASRCEYQEKKRKDDDDLSFHHETLAFKEACSLHKTISRTLTESRAGLQWVLGLGYVTVWTTLHRAEEALFEIDPKEMVIRRTIHDYLSIKGSSIANQDELLEKLIQAVMELDPAAAVYFKEHQPDKNSEELLKVKQELDQLVQAFKQHDPSVADKFDHTTSGETSGNPTASAEGETRARVTLREIRRTLDDYRDNRWQGLIRARNQLLCTIALTGLVTHLLLCIAILNTPPTPDAQTTILAGTIFYIVGAIAGMFGRFYKESQTSSAVDDYGLSFVRLIATPILSGLAGVGGVFITALLYSTLLGGQMAAHLTVTLQNIFQFEEPRYLLAAAIFGLAPNLIIRSLEKSADKYVSGLETSKGSESMATAGDGK